MDTSKIITDPAADPRGSRPVHNPANGTVIGHVVEADPAEIAHAVARSRAAQGDWDRTPWARRKIALTQFSKLLSADADSWADAIRAEVGKPRGEALGEVLTTLDAIRWTLKNAGKVLADRTIGPGWQRLMLIPNARLRWRPRGVVGVVGTWNYPLFLNAPAIVQALAAGNGVVWKPSENAALCGQKLQNTIEACGLPVGLVSAVQGGAEVGRALASSKVDLGMFTGGLAAGRSALGAWGANGVPTLAELSGFDPAIVMPDATVKSAGGPLTWGAFVGSGQTCVSIKRIYVIGDSGPWAIDLARRAEALRVGDPGSGDVDLGPLISESGRRKFDETIARAVQKGGTLITSVNPSNQTGCFVRPAVILATTDAPERELEGVFGPVVVIRGVADEDEAVAAANSSGFALGASVWGRDKARLRAVADRLEAGMVALNDAVTTSAHSAAPFGGVKSSGHGRIKGEFGLREFSTSQVVHALSPGGFRPQIFPYSARLDRLMHLYRRLLHPAANRPKH
ncbi:aldehyde dehydrogenase family protein [Isosphaeraceae bacterium EP7]